MVHYALGRLHFCFGRSAGATGCYLSLIKFRIIGFMERLAAFIAILIAAATLVG